MENKKILSKIKLRKHLDADSLFKAVYSDFEKFPDIRFGNISISLSDALMSGFAIFSLKDPSLPAFDNRLQDKSILKNIESVYGICNVPGDSRMRESSTMSTLHISSLHLKLFFGKFNVAVRLTL